eukprot:UN15657
MRIVFMSSDHAHSSLYQFPILSSTDCFCLIILSYVYWFRPKDIVIP